MTGEVWLGLVLTLGGGVLAGNSMLPMKFARRWAWENTWLVFTLVSLAALPWLLAFAMTPNVLDVYASLRPAQFAVPLSFGFGWGIAQVLFGLSVARLGLALGYAVIIGLGASLGTLVPLFLSHREMVATAKGTMVLCGVAVMIVGIAVSAIAGRQRESTGERAYGAAILLAVFCGILAPMLNFSFAFAGDVSAAAIRMGASPERAAYAVWPVGLTGGLIPNLAYSMYLLTKNKTWGRFRAVFPDALFAGLMGVFWMGAMSVYGLSSVYLGALGTSAGWALFQIFMIITANVSGVVTGEWSTAPRKARRTLWAGLALLALATAIIAAGNR